jgi:hypothetical protein
LGFLGLEVVALLEQSVMALVLQDLLIRAVVVEVVLVLAHQISQVGRVDQGL